MALFIINVYNMLTILLERQLCRQQVSVVVEYMAITSNLTLVWCSLGFYNPYFWNAINISCTFWLTKSFSWWRKKILLIDKQLLLCHWGDSFWLLQMPPLLWLKYQINNCCDKQLLPIMKFHLSWRGWSSTCPDMSASFSISFVRRGTVSNRQTHEHCI